MTLSSVPIWPDQSESLGGTIAPIASSVERSEAPKALRESIYRYLPQENPAAVSDNLDNPEKNLLFPDYLRLFSQGRQK